MSNKKRIKKHKNRYTSKIFNLVEKNKEAVIIGCKLETFEAAKNQSQEDIDDFFASNIGKFYTAEDLNVVFQSYPTYMVIVISESLGLQVAVKPEVALQWLEAGKLVLLANGIIT
jgi:hypothetical protein